MVGVGASAGGLEALTKMLNHFPPDIGMAFVLVQHLASGHDSIMNELLTRETTLTASEITDGMQIAANQVYVIPTWFYLRTHPDTADRHGALVLE